MRDESSADRLENHWAGYLYEMFFDRSPMAIGCSLSHETISSMSTFSFTLINTKTGEQAGMQVHVVRPNERPARSFNWFELRRERVAEKIFSESQGTILLLALRTVKSSPHFVASGPGGLLSIDNWSFLVASMVPEQLLCSLQRVRINPPEEVGSAEMIFAFPSSLDHATAVTCDAGERGRIACTTQAYIANERLVLTPDTTFTLEATEPPTDVAIRVLPELDEPHMLRIASAPHHAASNMEAQWLHAGHRLAIHLCERPYVSSETAPVQSAHAECSDTTPAKNADEARQRGIPIPRSSGNEQETPTSSLPRATLPRSGDCASATPSNDTKAALETTILAGPEIDETVKLSRAEVLRTVENATASPVDSTPDES